MEDRTCDQSNCYSRPAVARGRHDETHHVAILLLLLLSFAGQHVDREQSSCGAKPYNNGSGGVRATNNINLRPTDSYGILVIVFTVVRNHSGNGICNTSTQ